MGQILRVDFPPLHLLYNRRRGPAPGKYEQSWFAYLCEVLLTSVKKLTILIREMSFGCLHTEVYPNPRPVPNLDEPSFDDRVGEPIDNVIPPVRLSERILKGDVILRQCRRHLNV